jgi:rRNA processing protein Krr1/Pno1
LYSVHNEQFYHYLTNNNKEGKRKIGKKGRGIKRIDPDLSSGSIKLTNSKNTNSNILLQKATNTLRLVAFIT